MSLSTFLLAVHGFIEVLRLHQSKNRTYYQGRNDQERSEGTTSACQLRWRLPSCRWLELRILDNVKIYTNYGDAKDPLSKFVVPRTE